MKGWFKKLGFIIDNDGEAQQTGQNTEQPITQMLPFKDLSTQQKQQQPQLYYLNLNNKLLITMLLLLIPNTKNHHHHITLTNTLH